MICCKRPVGPSRSRFRMLPPPTRDEVGIAYLLFRIVDTFEDATRWPPAPSASRASATSCRLLERARSRARRAASPSAALAIRPSTTPATWSCCARSRSCCAACTPCRPTQPRHPARARQALGRRAWSQVVARCDGTGRVSGSTTLQELRDYCYVVAGIVGEMLTELFLLDRSAASPPSRDYLRAALAAVRRRRCSWSTSSRTRRSTRARGASTSRAAQQPEVMALARDDLRAAAEYTLALQRAGRRARAGRLQRAAGAAGDGDAGGHRGTPPRQQALPRRGAGDPGRT